jgi:2-keto-4-pentenoate hydratase
VTAVWEDPRVVAGSARMLAERERRLAGGERPVGYKLAFGSASARRPLRLPGPLVGFFNDANLLEDGEAISIGGWTRPALEPEIALHLSHDVPAGATRECAARAVGALGAAIELADVDPDLVDVEEILAGDLYQRHVVLGPPDPALAGAETGGIAASVLIDGEEVAGTDDPTAACGDLLGLVQHTAEVLSAFGERLRGGDVLIAGSVTPLVWPLPGQKATVRLPPLGELSVRFLV